MPSAETPILSNIHVYPIKSCHSIQLDECQIGNLGLEYDRRFVIVEEKNGRFITQRLVYIYLFICLFIYFNTYIKKKKR